MSDSYSFYRGSVPLLVSVPHDGRQLPTAIESRMTNAGLLIPDTDWHVARLYKFSRQLGACMIVANNSRYVVDLNRSPEDDVLYEGQTVTGLCPRQTFAGHDIYVDGVSIDAAEQTDRIQRYWRPYHDKIDATLAALCDQFGYALLWDAHSIPSRVPRLFDGELPVLNLGTWEGLSCDDAFAHAVCAVADNSPYDAVQNARFKGGYITRHYGKPERHVHAIQLEVAQRAYMDEMSAEFDAAKASRLIDTLRNMITAFLSAAERSSQ